MPSELLRPDNHDRAQQMQRMGLTLTEIANRLDVDRSVVVDELYTKAVADKSPTPEVVPTKRAYAGAGTHLRLKSADGRWLHRDADSMTLVRADAWIGTPQQLFELRQQHPNLNKMTVSEA